jgi:hypothetical protein
MREKEKGPGMMYSRKRGLFDASLIVFDPHLNNRRVHVFRKERRVKGPATGDRVSMTWR